VKCKRCKLDQKESAVQYAKRIRYDFNEPFICRDCRRIEKALNYEPEVVKKHKFKTEIPMSIPLLMRRYGISHQEAKSKIEKKKLDENM